ncbi:hypothetical protein [Candidatus Palauibacter sp.]|uniref:hypothetical protein n=1 Tax=Candidatus Palauibacter sp. TaxID=3101350 RepID=UPI003B02798C
MKGDELPDDDHVVRYAKPTLVREDGSVGGEAFQLRSGEESLSVNWLECFPGVSKPQQVAEVRRRSRLRLRPTGRFAELQAGRTKQHVHEEIESLRFVHDPLSEEGEFEPDPSHSEITGLPPADSPEAELVGDMIAECVTAVHPSVG